MTTPAIYSWRRALTLLLALASGHALVVLATGISSPLLDLHSFRQTQTALSAYTILKGGPWLAYETPVLGYPWSVPLEFPIYQLLCAALAWAGLPLDAAGRLVGFSFFLAVLLPLALLYKTAGFGRATYLVTAILYLTSPLYLYWSRTFLVESCALFFSVSWLALTARYLATPNRYWLLAAIVCGSLAALAKSTTFPTFVVIGGILTLIRLWASFQTESYGRLLRMATFTIANLLLPLVVGILWVRYSDHVKAANPYGQLLTSEVLTSWNFGSFGQRLGAVLWLDTVRDRVVPEVLGRFALVAVIVLGATLTNRRTLAATGLAMIGFAVPFLVFTNLHIIHNYYQYANAIFLIAAIGFGLGQIYNSSQRAIAVGLTAVIAIGQLSLFYDRFAPFITRDYSQDTVLRVAQFVRETTDEGGALIVIGTDWSSVIPYLSQRRSLAVPSWTPKPLIEGTLKDPQRFLGDAPMVGVVYCASQLSAYKENAELVTAFIRGRERLFESGGCEFLSPGRL
ncbi:phospholipid carrier-dependent glycosyltransferase [Rhodopseudomonas palustris]|nr:phospholipid carrier-dependent glycosyltransferase [Rhodopseudomonas palustris]